MEKVIIIGAGVSALSLAAQLSIKYNVEIYEKNASYGGKLGERVINNYRFDLGPSLFTYPQLLSDIFSRSNQKLDKYFNYIKLEESCRYFFEDETKITAHSDAEKFAEVIDANTSDDKSSVLKRLNYCKYIFNTTETVFLDQSLHLSGSYFNMNTFRSAFKLPFIGLFKSIHQKNCLDFNDPRTIQIFDRFATYNGSDPFKAPATLNAIPHLELNMGSYFPVKGMRSIADSLYKLCIDNGVTFNFNSNVEEIIIKKNKAVGIINKKVKIPAEIIVSNVDVFFTYKELLKDQFRPDYLSENELSSSAIIFYWGVKHDMPDFGLHNIIFSSDYKKEFEMLFNESDLSDDLTIYINISSKIKASDAPKGCSNLFVMINTPPTNDQSQIDTMIKKSRKVIIDKLNKMLDIDFEILIETELIRTPKDLEVETGAYKGALYGMNSNKIMSAFKRHPNFNRKIRNLYFCGGTVHPGGGIPLAIKSANIVNELINER